MSLVNPDSCDLAPIKKIDLDFLIDEFNLWQEQTENLQKENQILKEKVNSCGRLLESSQTRETRLEKELKDVHQMVDKLQSVLAKRCDKDDENRQLKETIEELHKDIEKLNEDHKQEVIRLEKCLEDIKLKHKQEQDELRKSLQQIGEKEKRSYQSEVEERDHLVRDLRRQVSDTEREKQTELIRVRIEYDAKLVKLQTQLSKAQQNSHSSTTQDIFRKKLQHQREESEREIGTLKRTIMDLEERLHTTPQHPQPSQPIIAPPRNSYPYKRPRKY